jgi:hypothetical protein
MFAKYLRQAVSVEQIGYYDLIAQSAEQYARRLLKSKASRKDVKRISKALVHDYKDHSFVIDREEARELLGKEWVKDGTPEVAAAEEIYTMLYFVMLFLALRHKCVSACGLAGDAAEIHIMPARKT